MYRIKCDWNPTTTQAYLNKQAKKGYILSDVIEMTLFVPLIINIYHFTKSNHYQRIYQLEEKSIEKIKECKKDGWKVLQHHAHMKTYTILYKDVNSYEEPKQSLTMAGIKEGLILLMIFGLWKSMDSYSTQSWIGNLLHNSYGVIAIVTLAVGIITYVKNRKEG